MAERRFAAGDTLCVHSDGQTYDGGLPATLLHVTADGRLGVARCAAGEVVAIELPGGEVIDGGFRAVEVPALAAAMDAAGSR